MKIAVIIPARYGSTRLPAKMLRLIGNKTVIEHSYQQAIQSKADAVIVATDHQAIADTLHKINAKVILTDANLPSGTDRCAQAFQILQQQGSNYDYIINVQGDEVFIPPAQIDLMIDSLKSINNNDYKILTFVQRITDSSQLTNPNIVKAVLGQPNEQKISPALYFSRAEIPFNRDISNTAAKTTLFSYYKHVGIYGFAAQTLLDLVKLKVADLEKIEMLEQLRWLENGYKIGAIETHFSHLSIDTAADLEAAQQIYLLK
jgi:3-deoxy-manno-octulosonate cytidylyltransferase (CMP-KDO synthetase)